MRRSTSLYASLLAVASLAAATPARAQVTLGQIDTFEGGTTQNWAIKILGPFSPGGATPPPASALPAVQLGGPGGAADHYLRLHSVGGTGLAPEPGSRLAVVNYAGQWVGDYLAAGINAIRMDANNLGDTDLLLRLLFENPGLPPAPSPPTIEAVSAVPIRLPAHSGWQSLLFPLLGPGGLTVLGGGDVNALPAGTTAIRILNAPAVADNGPAVVATLGVDNITALATPEPSALALLATGAALVGLRRRRRVR